MISKSDNLPPILPLELKSVSFKVRNRSLIKNLNCHFKSNKQTVIIGPNGAGKSLLMRLCHGLIKPTNGIVKWHDSGNSRGHPYIIERQAMVFQRPIMLRRTVSGNVEYALSTRGTSKEKKKIIVNDVLNKTGLQAFSTQSARTLSGGEQQRLALARAWALTPEVLFLDEPTANLDPSATYRVEEIIKAIQKSGTTIIMTTHDLGQARRMADQVIFLHQGHLIEDTPAKLFFLNPKNELTKAFLHGELLWWENDTKLE